MEAKERKSRLDYLITKLNINSIEFAQGPGGGEGAVIDQMMVWGALGLGDGSLSTEAYLLGRAVYQQDPGAVEAMKVVGAEHITKMFQQHNWSATKPYQAHLRKLHDDGFSNAEIERAKKQCAQKMPFLLAQLAISEIANNGNCITCNGTGRTRNYRECRQCAGSGKRPYSERYKADFILIDDGQGSAYKQWHRTWRGRYAQILQMFQQWESDFLKHLVRYT